MEYRLKASRAKRRILKHLWLARIGAIAVVIVALAIFFSIVAWLFNRYRVTEFVEPATNFIFSTNVPIKNQDGITNVLVLGKGGEGHDAPELTDTIILASISKNPSEVTLISLPRDLYLVDEQLKINHAFLNGSEKGGTQAGLDNAKRVISKVTGQTIDYVAVVDFSGFTKLIDALGGVEVNVERGFTDNRYPIEGKENDLCGLRAGMKAESYPCRYETLTFSEGLQTMDGQTALKFARSRHSTNPFEGSDFARAARQQKIIDGIRRKVMSTDLIFNPDKVSELISIGQQSVTTDITPEEGAVLARIAFDARDNLKNHVLDTNLLYEPPVVTWRYFGQFVILPKGIPTDFSEIQSWVKKILSS